MTYQQACDFLFGLRNWSNDRAYQPGLDRIRTLLDVLGRPDRAYPIVHVAGTNGKGSVCAMIASMATAGGHRVGLHTSPHLFSFTERMRVNGVGAPEQWVADATQRLSEAIMDVGATFFEASTAMALEYFAACEVDLAVVEVGMGGRLDATNIVSPVLSIITNVGLDHTEHLGTTLAAIAAEKAGIIKDRVPVVTGCLEPEAASVIRGAAERAGSTLTDTCEMDVNRSLYGIDLDFGGRHQLDNAMIVLRAADELETLLPQIRLERIGLERVRQLSGLRGRSEILSINPLIVADVAHNPDGIKAALQFVRSIPGVEDLYVLIGIARDKDIEAIMSILASFNVSLYLADVPSPRLAEPEALAESAKRKALRIVEIGSPTDLLKRFSETSGSSASLLATGSHFVIGALTQELFKRAETPGNLGGGMLL